MIGVLVLLAAVTSSPLPDVGFSFRGADRPGPRDGVPVELEVGSDTVRADLLVEDAISYPRWRWVDGASSETGRVTLHATAGSLALIVVRRPGRPGYRLDGPFRWPASPLPRRASLRAVRALRGTGLVGPHAEIRLAGSPGSELLCEHDRKSEWQCAGVPSDLAGRIVFCDGGRPLAAADVRPGPPDAVAVRVVSDSALIRLETLDPADEPRGAAAQVLRPAGAGGALLAPARDWKVEDLGGGLLWLEGKSDPALVVEARAPRHASVRIPLASLGSACGEPLPVALLASPAVAGTVSDGEGRPVPDALVLVRPGEPEPAETVVADATTDANGNFWIEGLAPGRYRLRACRAEFGCGEASATPGETITIALDAAALFTGRVLSIGGIPEPGADVRLVPVLDGRTHPADRLARLPLQTSSGGDGRFSIAAPAAGDFLLEIRSESSGVARLPVRRSRLSPPVTDVGDVRLPDPLDLAVRVAGCAGGALSMSGPLGGETSLPAFLRFALDAGGAAIARLPEGGSWTAWATCGGENVTLEPALLPDAAALQGMEVRFERAGTPASGQSIERSK